MSTIQEVSRRSGLPEPTLRYYEKIGLIGPVDRDESSGHRRYPPELVETIEALGCLRSTGMSLADMRVYLRHLDGGDPAEQRDLFARNVERLDAEIERLRVRRDYLRLKAELWDARDRRDAAAEERAVDEIRGLLPRLK
ncbi:MerR family transcriptional regulator [Amycolatopsis tucumanensis]|uniref:HTH merR-type domain-containing protein n=1 Tax=Amycolatopsis tucumanensis TaxID=401106 RepID=A0ABP7JIS9_9PSEU|nr:MerR family transcriptional regulator [Amycolatopsis tucumanensis]MCF6426700.1 MerR family transcriptional regulator [Amycolatopsis tucumanensis]